MDWTSSQIAVVFIGVVHVGFMLGELYPWEKPRIMEMVLKKWDPHLDLSNDEHHFAAMVVHNAGIYNGIVAVGLFAAAWLGQPAHAAQVALLAGGIVAGLFGYATLTKATIVQAVLGAIALGVVVVMP